MVSNAHISRSTARADAAVKISWIAPVIMLLVVAVFSILTLSSFPTAFIDEGWNANRSWALLQTGRAFAGVDNGVYQQFDGYWTYFPYLATLIHAISIWAFGLSLESMRLVSVFFGLVLLLVVYVIAQRLYNRRIALISMLLLASSAPFILSSHLGRHDIIVTALGFGAVALYLSDRSSNLSVISVLSGLAIGLSFDIHLNILIFGPVMLTLCLLDYGINALRTGRFWGFVLGGLAGSLYFVAMHILPYPQTYFAMGSLGNGQSRTPPILSVDLDIWRESFLSTVNMLDLILLPVIIPAGIFLFRRWSNADKKVVALAGMTIICVAAFIRFKQEHYEILIAPAIALLLAPYLNSIAQTGGKITGWTFWRNLLVLGIIVGSSVINLAVAMRDSNPDYRKVLSYIGETIPDGSVVYGNPSYWFALPRNPYMNIEQIVFRQRYVPGSTFTDAVEAIKPDYLIIDGFVGQFVLDDETCREHFSDIPCMPQVELATLLKERATLVGDLKTRNFGDVQIYKMDLASKGQAGSQK